MHPPSTFAGVYPIRGTQLPQAPPVPASVLNEERNHFFENIKAFNASRSVALFIPRIGHTEVDLFNYTVKQVADVIGIPETSTNAGYLLGKHYRHLLLSYELVHLWGSTLAEAFENKLPSRELPMPSTPAAVPIQSFESAPLPVLPFNIFIEDIVSRPLFKYDFTEVDSVDLANYSEEDTSIHKLCLFLESNIESLIQKGLSILLYLSNDKLFSFCPARYPLLLPLVLKIASNLPQVFSLPTSPSRRRTLEICTKALVFLRNIAQTEETAKVLAESDDYPMLICSILSSSTAEHELLLISLDFFAALSPFLSLSSINPDKQSLDLSLFIAPLVSYMTNPNLFFCLSACTSLLGLCLNPLNEDRLIINSKVLIPSIIFVLNWSQDSLFQVEGNSESVNFDLVSRIHYQILTIIFYFSDFDISSKVAICKPSVVQCLIQLVESPSIVPNASKLASRIVASLLAARPNVFVFRQFYDSFIKAGCGLTSRGDEVDLNLQRNTEHASALQEIRYWATRIALC
ncbi:hypothetical protein GEMRC1_000226 [Eukaryota sp. GEM-RC1]